MSDVDYLLKLEATQKSFWWRPLFLPPLTPTPWDTRNLLVHRVSLVNKNLPLLVPVFWVILAYLALAEFLYIGWVSERLETDHWFSFVFLAFSVYFIAHNLIYARGKKRVVHLVQSWNKDRLPGEVFWDVDVKFSLWKVYSASLTVFPDSFLNPTYSKSNPHYNDVDLPAPKAVLVHS